jgi:hypothetical protein
MKFLYPKFYRIDNIDGEQTNINNTIKINNIGLINEKYNIIQKPLLLRLSKYVIDFDSTYKTEFLCYYYFKGSDYDNKFTFTVYSSGSQEFDVYFVIYPRDGNAFVYRIPSPSINNYFVYTSNNVKKGSIYFDIGRGENLDKVSIEIIYNEYDDYPPSGPSGSTSKSSSSNTWLIVGIIIGAVVLIALIIVGVCLYSHCKKKGAIKVANVSTSNMNY